jgi:hypothetical protein
MVAPAPLSQLSAISLYTGLRGTTLVSGKPNAMYEGMPMVDFITSVLGIDLWEGQKEIVNSIDNNFATAVKSAHGTGKSFCMAAAALAFLHTRIPSVVVTTAPTNRQVRGILWRNLRAHYRRAPGNLLGSKPLQLEYNISEDHFAVGFKGANEDSDSAQGFHSPNLLAIVDEAAGVAEAVISSMDNIVTGDGSRLVYIGNPTSMDGRFRRAFHEDADLYNTITISAEDTPNIKAGAVVREGLIDQQYIDRTIRQFGRDSPWTQARIYARFPDQADDSLISLSHIEAAQVRGYGDVDHGMDAPVRMGVDVARTGSDESAFWIRHGDVTVHRSSVHGHDTMQVVGRTRAAMDAVALRLGIDPYAGIQVRVDVIGLGAGVADRLRELGYDVVDVNVASKSSDRTLWPNLRNELWWNLAEKFRAGRVAVDTDEKMTIDEGTVSQLASIRAKYGSVYARPIIEGKDDMKKRLNGRSPDRAEAMMLCYSEDWQVVPPSDIMPLSAGSFGVSGSTGWQSQRGMKRRG